jgi:hypothetical protein
VAANLISFDLDDTLICYAASVPRERNPVPWPLRRWFREPVRQGTRQLLRALTSEGWRIAVYTTSGRGIRSVAWLLSMYGTRPAFVVNQRVHQRAVAQAGLSRPPSKLPSLFGIHLHVDDSDGVAEEGRRFGFPVVVVRPDDRDWTGQVLNAARRLRGTDRSSNGPAHLRSALNPLPARRGPTR